MSHDCNRPGRRLSETLERLAWGDANGYPQHPCVRVVIAPKDEQQFDAASAIRLL